MNEEMNIKDYVLLNNLGIVYENIDIKDYISIRISAICKSLILPNSFISLIEILKVLKNEKYYLLGFGSNTIFSSKNLIDNIISLKNIEPYYEINDDILKISSNFSLKKISYLLADLNYTNLEFFSSIPGSIGGAVIMNSGCYKNEIKDYFIGCTCIDEDGNKYYFDQEKMNFSYRNSFLKGKKYIIIEALFKIKKTDENIRKTIDNWKYQRLLTQPLEYPNSGSVFKNDIIPAWKMIEMVNLRGKIIGGAMFSLKHCNFIINIDNASGEDVKELIELAKFKVKEELNINLQEEVLLLNF